MSLSKNAKTYLLHQKFFRPQNVFTSRITESSILQPPSASTKKDSQPNLSIKDMPIAVKDNICTKDLPTTAASNILKGFVSPYDATVVKLLRNAGAVVVGKTNMDEFGMGSHSTNSHAGPVRMQRHLGEERSAGGSSGGSALAVASSQCWAALGTDTGGSVRLPAAYTGVVGFKPSYGLLSRWGVIAYANSLDTVGILARDAQCAKILFEKLNHYDPQDPTSLPLSTRARLTPDEKHPKSLRIGIPLDYNIATLDPTVRSAWLRSLEALAEKGHTLHPVRLPATQHALSAYYILAPAEASSNLAKYDGVRFGTRAEGMDGSPHSVLFAKSRGQGLGEEVQRRILLGAFSLSAQAIDNYFIQAQKVRRLVQQDFDKVFAKSNPLIEEEVSGYKEDGVDVLLCPTAPTMAPSLSKIERQNPIQAYMNDVFTVPASLAGLPAISVPVSLTKKEHTDRHGEKSIRDSVGMQIIGQYGDDHVVLHVAKALQRTFPSNQLKGGASITAWGSNPLGPASAIERNRYGDYALQKGMTIAEIKKLAPTKKDMRNILDGIAIKMMREKLGDDHIWKAAALAQVDEESYLRKFSHFPDPVTAEQAYFARRLSRKRVREDQDGKEKFIPVERAYAEHKESRRRDCE